MCLNRARLSAGFAPFTLVAGVSRFADATHAQSRSLDSHGQIGINAIAGRRSTGIHKLTRIPTSLDDANAQYRYLIRNRRTSGNLADIQHKLLDNRA